MGEWMVAQPLSDLMETVTGGRSVWSHFRAGRWVWTLEGVSGGGNNERRHGPGRCLGGQEPLARFRAEKAIMRESCQARMGRLVVTSEGEAKTRPGECGHRPLDGICFCDL